MRLSQLAEVVDRRVAADLGPHQGAFDVAPLRRGPGGQQRRGRAMREADGLAGKLLVGLLALSDRDQFHRRDQAAHALARFRRRGPVGRQDGGLRHVARQQRRRERAFRHRRLAAALGAGEVEEPGRLVAAPAGEGGVPREEHAVGRVGGRGRRAAGSRAFRSGGAGAQQDERGREGQKTKTHGLSLGARAGRRKAPARRNGARLYIFG
ncbi:hypothetical protein LRS10_18540 [Phenylobacterium sp. J426]|nr:hypothetical protein [Phenylobacterium sp. J426]MCR5875970.1 hypothetical protein [Phenylobacterium sp. J426]